jgi:NADPH-dependent curcumin reductase
VGIAGGPQKTQLCTKSFGFDAAVDYKAPDFAQQLAAVCKGGVDVYFDNTAGPISDAVHNHLNTGARIVVCGTPEHEDVALHDLAGWLRSGQLRYLEDVLDGIDQAPGAIAGLYRGDNLGKRLIRLTRE